MKLNEEQLWARVGGEWGKGKGNSIKGRAGLEGAGAREERYKSVKL